jgi:hypothetical protein
LIFSAGRACAYFAVQRNGQDNMCDLLLSRILRTKKLRLQKTHANCLFVFRGLYLQLGVRNLLSSVLDHKISSLFILTVLPDAKLIAIAASSFLNCLIV